MALRPSTELHAHECMMNSFAMLSRTICEQSGMSAVNSHTECAVWLSDGRKKWRWDGCCISTTSNRHFDPQQPLVLGNRSLTAHVPSYAMTPQDLHPSALVELEDRTKQSSKSRPIFSHLYPFWAFNVQHWATDSCVFCAASMMFFLRIWDCEYWGATKDIKRYKAVFVGLGLVILAD